jgi:hypothetical protein
VFLSPIYKPNKSLTKRKIAKRNFALTSQSNEFKKNVNSLDFSTNMNLDEIKSKKLSKETKESTKKFKCNCFMSKCKKKYCACFGKGEKCKNCECIGCENKEENGKKKINKNETNAENTFCNCSKSNCIKLYCECFKSGKMCNDLCRCLNCENCDLKKKKTMNIGFERTSVSYLNSELIINCKLFSEEDFLELREKEDLKLKEKKKIGPFLFDKSNKVFLTGNSNSNKRKIGKSAYNDDIEQIKINKEIVTSVKVKKKDEYTEN